MLLLLLACSAGPANTPAKPTDTDAGADSAPEESPPDDSDVPLTTWYADSDGDGYGDATESASGGEAPAGYVGDAGDCDDTDPAVHPGGIETCDGRDEDCDSVVDEGASATWYVDTDADGWGGEVSIFACPAPEGHVAAVGDCDDAEPTVHPDAIDACEDGVDQDCYGGDLRCGVEGTHIVSEVAGTTWLGSREGPGDLAGTKGVCDADTDGDGVAEIILYASEQFRRDYTGEDELGRLWVIDTWTPGVHDLDDESLEIVGESEGLFSYIDVLSSPGDLDGDGDDELLAGAWLLSAPFPAVVDEAPVQFIDATQTESRPWAVVPLGDQLFALSGDYHALGNVPLSIGAVFVLDGLPAAGLAVAEDLAVATLAPASSHLDTWFGSSLCAGDLDGDGVLDLVAGAPSSVSGDTPSYLEVNQGVVYVRYGPFDGDIRMSRENGGLDGADAGIWAGEIDVARSVGSTISCGGDVTGDGLDDLLVGSCCSGATSDVGDVVDVAGAVWLFTEPLAGEYTTNEATGTIRGIENNDAVGGDVESDVDVDADGRADVVLAASLPSAHGALAVFYDPPVGSHSLWEGDLVLRGVVEGDYLATSFSGCPDLNGDGADELLLGAPGESTNATWSGAAYLILGGGLE